MARLFATLGVKPLHEQFRKNPFYEAFYENPGLTAFETEITFLLQHYHAQRRATEAKQSFCADFSTVLDHAYATVTLSRSDLRVFETVLSRVEPSLSKRSLLVVLRCPAEVKLRRIRKRNRKAEAAITLEYLRKIDLALQVHIDSISDTSRMITVDSYEFNFAHNARDKRNVLRIIRAELDKVLDADATNKVALTI
jgi:deoxyadenosine/deoxycytidine kinase